MSSALGPPPGAVAANRPPAGPQQAPSRHTGPGSSGRGTIVLRCRDSGLGLGQSFAFVVSDQPRDASHRSRVPRVSGGGSQG